MELQFEIIQIMRPTIAVIDADAATLREVRTLLGTLNADVETFGTAESYFAHAKQAWACVIVDVSLPGMSGVQLLKTIRAKDRDLPVIVMASEADVPVAVEAMRQGATDFIEKPQIDIALLRRVAELLRNGNDASSGRPLTTH